MRLQFVVALSALFMYGPALDVCAQATGDTGTAPHQSEVKCVDKYYNPGAKPLPLPGPVCEKEVFARRGRPFMFPAHDGIAYGVSLEPGEPPSLNLWVDNQTNEAKTIDFCCGSTLYHHIDIFDSEGHRVPSRYDQYEREAFSEGHEIVETCTCSGIVAILPHMMQIIDGAAVVRFYSLGPGRYTVSERQSPAQRFGPNNYEKVKAPAGLSISIQ